LLQSKARTFMSISPRVPSFIYGMSSESRVERSRIEHLKPGKLNFKVRLESDFEHAVMHPTKTGRCDSRLDDDF
jgi:hypothetical protein